MQELLKKNLHDTVRLQVLTDLHWAYINSEIEKAKDIAIKEINLAEKIKNEKWIAQGYNDLGIVFYKIGNIDSALYYYNKSLEIRKKLNEPKLLFSSYSKIGLIYYEKGLFADAIKIQLEALKIIEMLGDLRYKAMTYNNISQIYHQLKNYDKELEYLLEAEKIYNQINDEYAAAATWSNIANVISLKGDYQKSFQYLNKSLKVYEKHNDKLSIAGIYSLMGYNYRNFKKNDEALKYYLKAFELSNQLNNKIDIALNAHNISCVYSDLGRYDLAEKYSLISMNNVGEDNLKQQSMIYRQLAIIYANLKNGKKAEKYIIKFNDVKEKIFSDEFAHQIAEVETKYESEKKELQILNLHKQQELKDLTISKQKTRNKYLILLIICLLIIAGIIFYAFRSKAKANKIILLQKQEVENQKAIIEEKNKEIVDSINYARRIQNAILTSDNEWKKISNQYFIIYIPKDVVSGDFYWAIQLDNNLSIWAVADCTGHGVPGALMSMIGNSLLNEIVVENKIYKPDEILNKLREKLIKALEQKGESQNRDGMDIALCVWDKNNNTLYYAGANNPVWIIRKKNEYKEYDLIELKPDKMPVGLHTGELKPFNVQTFNLNYGDSIYAFTDGFSDQFGGEKGKKYKYKNFQAILLENADKSMQEQSEIIKNEFYNWKGNLEQIDDVCIVGIRV